MKLEELASNRMFRPMQHAVGIAREAVQEGVVATVTLMPGNMTAYDVTIVPQGAVGYQFGERGFDGAGRDSRTVLMVIGNMRTCAALPLDENQYFTPDYVSGVFRLSLGDGEVLSLFLNALVATDD